MAQVHFPLDMDLLSLLLSMAQMCLQECIMELSQVLL